MLAKANPLSLFSTMVLLKQVSVLVNTANVLSAVKEITGNVENNRRSILI